VVGAAGFISLIVAPMWSRTLVISSSALIGLVT
jgi:hypothetical protein